MVLLVIPGQVSYLDVTLPFKNVFPASLQSWDETGSYLLN